MSDKPHWELEDNAGTNKGYLRLTYDGIRVADFFPFAAGADEQWVRGQAALIVETMNKNS